MSVEDSLLQLRVRAILVRNWVDTRMLNFNVIGGVIHLQGMLAVTYEHPDYDPSDDHGISDRVLLKLDQDLKRLAEVKAIRYDLTNWSRSGIGWVKRAHIR